MLFVLGFVCGVLGFVCGVAVTLCIQCNQVSVQGEENNLFVVIKNQLYYLVGPIRGKV